MLIIEYRDAGKAKPAILRGKKKRFPIQHYDFHPVTFPIYWRAIPPRTRRKFGPFWIASLAFQIHTTQPFIVVFCLFSYKNRICRRTCRAPVVLDFARSLRCGDASQFVSVFLCVRFADSFGAGQRGHANRAESKVALTTQHKRTTQCGNVRTHALIAV